MKGLKKALGQNFFNNPNLADSFVNTVKTNNPKNIIEIGPGDGFFTKRLISITDKVTVIEKDVELSHNLSLKYPNIEIINQDFLELNLSTLDINHSTVIFGSLPYNVSKHIITSLLEKTTVQNMFFILQKEVAQKYADSNESSIQYITTKLYADTKILKYISPGSFIPAPKVESAYVYMKRNNNSANLDVKSFITFVKNAFKSPRKTLRNNLKGFEFIDNQEVLGKRPSQLNFTDYVSLFKSLK